MIMHWRGMQHPSTTLTKCIVGVGCFPCDGNTCDFTSSPQPTTTYAPTFACLPYTIDAEVGACSQLPVSLCVSEFPKLLFSLPFVEGDIESSSLSVGTSCPIRCSNCEKPPGIGSCNDVITVPEADCQSQVAVLNKLLAKCANAGAASPRFVCVKSGAIGSTIMDASGDTGDAIKVLAGMLKEYTRGTTQITLTSQFGGLIGVTNNGCRNALEIVTNALRSFTDGTVHSKGTHTCTPTGVHACLRCLRAATAAALAYLAVC